MVKNLKGHEYYSLEWAQDLKDCFKGYSHLTIDEIIEYRKQADDFKYFLEPLIIKCKDDKAITDHIFNLMIQAGIEHDKKYNVVYPDLEYLLNSKE